jgi:hypothetical protein
MYINGLKESIRGYVKDLKPGTLEVAYSKVVKSKIATSSLPNLPSQQK